MEAALLVTIKEKLAELERVQVIFGYEYEDGVYRFLPSVIQSVSTARLHAERSRCFSKYR
jgi:hypothetical protein